MMIRSIAKTILKSPLKTKAPLFAFSNFKKENSMAVFIFVLQLSFFIILNLVNFFHQ